MKQVLFAAVLALALPSVGFATVLDCKVDAGTALGGWISPQYIFEYDADAATVKVVDGLILSEVQAPVDGKVADSSAKRVTFTWAVMTKDNRGQLVKMLYRATYFHKTKAVTVSGTPSGYRGNFSARGSCTTK